MNRSTIRRTTRLSLALLAALSAAGASAEDGMPANCPMHAEHQKKKAEAAAAAAAAVVPASTSSADAHAGHAGHAASAPGSAGSAASPYVAMTGRAIAALSEEEIAALRAGTGHGLALPAEINHYPGPRHLLDMANDLDLDARDTRELQAIYERMKADAIALGEKMIAGERELDRLFSDGRATSAEVARLTAEIAQLQGELRATHLVAHVEAKALLSADQVARYDALRGYGSAAGAP